MSPSATGQPASVARDEALQHLLGDGEIVILAVKPSGWFVPLTSLPALAVLALLAVSGHYLGRMIPMGLGPQAIEVLCGMLAAGRFVVACCQWAGTLYVLTNRRVLRIRGALKVSITGCVLTEIRHTASLTTGLVERLAGVGTLFFQTDEGNLAGGEWQHISRPGEVRQAIDDAIRQAR